MPTDARSTDVAFTSSESDNLAVFVTNFANNEKRNIPLNLQFPADPGGRASEQYLQVHSANGIVFSPDGRYAFVAGKADIVNNTFFVQQDETPRYTGGNIGIIKDPLGANPQLVAATRPVPFGRPNDLTISPDGQYLYVGYQGIEVEVTPPVIEQQPDPNNPGEFIDVVIVPGVYAQGGVMIFDVCRDDRPDR